MPENRGKKLCLSGFSLKITAIVLMTIDHVGAVIVEPGILCTGDIGQFTEIMATETGRFWYLIDVILRTVGRMAFPIFCFLLVEGFLHTRSVKHYLLNLSIFALAAEIPFDLAVFGKTFNFNYQNIFFTLLIGLLTLIGIKRFAYHSGMAAVVTAAGCILAELFRVDYGYMGILIIVSFYLFRENKRHQFLLVGAITFFESISFSKPYYYFGAAALSLIPIYFYNGERGKKGFKYLFYFYYPVHLLTLFLLRTLLCG